MDKLKQVQSSVQPIKKNWLTAAYNSEMARRQGQVANAQRWALRARSSLSLQNKAKA